MIFTVSAHLLLQQLGRIALIATERPAWFAVGGLHSDVVLLNRKRASVNRFSI